MVSSGGINYVMEMDGDAVAIFLDATVLVLGREFLAKFIGRLMENAHACIS